MYSDEVFICREMFAVFTRAVEKITVMFFWKFALAGECRGDSGRGLHARTIEMLDQRGIAERFLAEGQMAQVAARVLRNTMAAVTLRRQDARTQAVRATIAEMLGMDEPRKHWGGMLSGLDIHYALGEGHPLLGRRMPDMDLVTAEGSLRAFTLLHKARPVLLNFGEPGSLDISPWADRVQLVDARYTGDWVLPVLGKVAAPGAVVVRPDGYVAWVGDAGGAGLAESLAAWFGVGHQ